MKFIYKRCYISLKNQHAQNRVLSFINGGIFSMNFCSDKYLKTKIFLYSMFALLTADAGL